MISNDKLINLFVKLTNNLNLGAHIVNEPFTTLFSLASSTTEVGNPNIQHSRLLYKEQPRAQF